jgi:hypothetical protein
VPADRSFLDYAFVSGLPKIPERAFDAVHNDLESVVAQLKQSNFDSNARHSLLRELRILWKKPTDSF